MLAAIMRAGRCRPTMGPGMAVAMVVAALGASCFDGADALGLPCLGDDDCGRGQRCEQGLCGGPPATEGSTGASGSSSESSTVADSGTAESTGPLPGCGNGVVEDGEDCDPGTGLDHPACDADCSAVRCGDGHVNAMAGEECDDTNDEQVDDCTPECRTTLFWDDIDTDPALTGRWLPPEIPHHDYEGTEFFLEEGWRWVAAMGDGTWHSGPYSADSGTARLITRPIQFPPEPGEGFRYELRLRHRLRFDGNPGDLEGDCRPSKSDGGVVWIMEPNGMLRPAGPPVGHPDVLDNPGSCDAALGLPDNPLYSAEPPRPAYSSATSGFVEVGFPLPPDVAGTTVSLVFEVGYDCQDCWFPPPDAGWTIDRVVVAPFRG
jgi:hypothetical protein